ncbi:MAG: hypothetical protein WC915_04875 [archaeon]|jgi:hypothetical protein
MNCKLCESDITNYSIEFNHLKINQTHEIDLCEDCIEKFTKWRQEKIARLFPTKNMKRLLKK